MQKMFEPLPLYKNTLILIEQRAETMISIIVRIASKGKKPLTWEVYIISAAHSSNDPI